MQSFTTEYRQKKLISIAKFTFSPGQGTLQKCTVEYGQVKLFSIVKFTFSLGQGNFYRRILLRSPRNSAASSQVVHFSSQQFASVRFSITVFWQWFNVTILKCTVEYCQVKLFSIANFAFFLVQGVLYCQIQFFLRLGKFCRIY